MRYNNSEYSIQNIQVAKLATEYGTPLYVYDASIIDRQIRKLQAAFSGFPHRINYAAKALTNIAVLKYMLDYDLGLDVVSINELKMGMDAGFHPQNILFTSNSVSFEEIQMAVNLGVQVNIDSISLLKRFAKTYGKTQPFSIRLKLDPLVDEHKASRQWHKKSKFGIHYSRLDTVKSLIEKYDLNLTGLHVHNSSSFLDIPVYLAAADRMFSIAMEFQELQFIDFGGGITIPFHSDDNAIDVNKLGKELESRVQNFYQKYESKPEIWFEPGRFLVSECGYLLTKVTVLKGDRDLPFAGTDTGFNHLLRPMMYEAFHEIYNISNPDGEKIKYHVCGNMCETDFLARNREIATIREGDLLAIKNAGAYGSCMASNYNSRPRPAEVMIRDGKSYLIKKRETYEDLIRNQIDPFQ